MSNGFKPCTFVPCCRAVNIAILVDIIDHVALHDHPRQGSPFHKLPASSLVVKVWLTLHTEPIDGDLTISTGGKSVARKAPDKTRT